LDERAHASNRVDTGRVGSLAPDLPRHTAHGDLEVALTPAGLSPFAGHVLSDFHGWIACGELRLRLRGFRDEWLIRLARGFVVPAFVNRSERMSA
jgi:hypothetical protein